MKKLILLWSLLSLTALHAGTNASVTFNTNTSAVNPPWLWTSNEPAIAAALTAAGFSGGGGGGGGTNAFNPTNFTTNTTGQVTLNGVPGSLVTGAVSSATTAATVGAIPVKNWNIAYLNGDALNSVVYNGVSNNYPGSTTAGLMETWTNFQTTLPGNFGPTVTGLKFVFGGQYYYYSTPIFMSNYYPFAVSFEGCDPISSKLIYTGLAVGTNCVTIKGGINPAATYSFPAHVFFSKLGFSATNNVTNILVDIENCAWCDFSEVNWQGWQIMTNQVNGAEMSIPQPPLITKTPALGGLRIVTHGDHLTSFENVVFGSLGWGADITCDHLRMLTVKCSLLGLAKNTTQGYTALSAWPTNTLYCYNPCLIRRGGLDCFISHAHNYAAGVFEILLQQPVGQTVNEMENFQDEGVPCIASFATDNAATLPKISNPSGSTYTASTMFVLSSNASGYFAASPPIAIPVEGFDPSGEFQVAQPGGKMVFGTNGLLTASAASLTNFLLNYLSFSNSTPGTVLPIMTVSNVSVITTNGAFTNGFVVSGAGTTAANGTYGLIYINLFAAQNVLGFSGETANGYDTIFGYAVFTNSLNNNYYLVLNDTNLLAANINVIPPPVWTIEQGLLGTVMYDSGATRPFLDPTTSSQPSSCVWENDSGTGSAPSVFYAAPVYATNNYNRLVVTSAVIATNFTNLANGNGSGLAGIPVPAGLAATGIPSASTYLNGAGAWSTPSGGGGIAPSNGAGTNLAIYSPGSAGGSALTISAAALSNQTNYVMQMIGGSGMFNLSGNGILNATKLENNGVSVVSVYPGVSFVAGDLPNGYGSGTADLADSGINVTNVELTTNAFIYTSGTTGFTNGAGGGLALALANYYTNLFGRRLTVYLSVTNTGTTSAAAVYPFQSNGRARQPIGTAGVAAVTNVVTFNLGPSEYFAVTNTLGAFNIMTNEVQIW